MKNPFDFRTDLKISADSVAAAEIQFEEFAKQEELPKTASNHTTVSKTNKKDNRS